MKTVGWEGSDPSLQEVDIDVQQVALEPMLKPPYRATVDFYMIRYTPVDHLLLRRPHARPPPSLCFEPPPHTIDSD